MASATSNDFHLQEVIKLIRGEGTSGIAHRKEVEAHFQSVLDELCTIDDGIVMRDLRIVLPETLQDLAVRTAHEGHQGRIKTKSIHRTKVWFAGMDAKADVLMDQCPLCQLNE